MGIIIKRSHSRLTLLTVLAGILSVSCLCSPTTLLTSSQDETATPTDPILSPIPTLPAIELPEQTSVVYSVDQNIVLLNDGPGNASKIVIWVAMIRDIPPYQDVLSTRINPNMYQEVYDEYGNLYAEFELLDLETNASTTIDLHYEIKVNPVDLDLANCSSAETQNDDQIPSIYTSPETHIESDADVIKNLSSALTNDAHTPCDQTAAIYEYTTGNMVYSGYNPGSNGALGAAETLQGDCTEFSDLTIALNRASNIPARFLEGVTCCTYSGYSEGDIKHDWLEVYLPGIGWSPMDPTWGRLDSKNETYFAGITPDHIIVTQGRNLSRLNGYHYYYYRYWWDDESASVDTTESWHIVHAEQ
jgi:transglutaminase-like putative cysteine protease